MLVLWLDHPLPQAQCGGEGWAERNNSEKENLKPPDNVLPFDRNVGKDSSSRRSFARRAAFCCNETSLQPSDSVALRSPATSKAEMPSRSGRDSCAAWLMHHFRGRVWLALELHRAADDAVRLAELRTFGTRHGLPLVAAGDVHMHVRDGVRCRT